MPINGFIDWRTGEVIGLDKAHDHFMHNGLMMGPAIQALVNNAGQGDERRGKGAGVSASIADPAVTCRRELIIRRHHDYAIDPRVLMDAEEGTLLHAAFFGRGRSGEGWGAETMVPSPADLADVDKPSVRLNPSGFPELELWPGVWFSCVVDYHTSDWTEIHDLKTKRVSKADYPPDRSAYLQLNLNKLAVERLYPQAKVERMFIWRYFRGCYEKERTWKRFDVPVWTEEECRALAEDHLASIIAFDEAASKLTGEELESFISSLPMDGKVKRMFNDKKCGMYCAVKSICFGLANKLSPGSVLEL